MKRVVSSDYIAAEGWDTDIEAVGDILDSCKEIGQLQYELENCVKGAFTSCEDYEDLAQHVINLGKRLQEAGDYLAEEAEYLD